MRAQVLVMRQCQPALGWVSRSGSVKVKKVAVGTAVGSEAVAAWRVAVSSAMKVAAASGVSLRFRAMLIRLVLAVASVIWEAAIGVAGVWMLSPSALVTAVIVRRFWVLMVTVKSICSVAVLAR